MYNRSETAYLGVTFPIELRINVFHEGHLLWVIGFFV